MRKFGYLIHPADSTQLRNFSTPFTAIARLFKKDSGRFTVRRIKNLSGFIIALPEMLKYSPEQEILIMDRIVTAAELAKRLGIDLLGLGGFTGLLCDKGYTAFRRMGLSLTSGSTYTAWSIYEAVFRVAKSRGLDLNKSTIAIINSTSAVGSLCARKLCSNVGKLILNSSEKTKLLRLKEDIAALCSIEAVIEKNVDEATTDADIIIWIDKALVDFKTIKLTVKTGLIKLPRPIKSGLNLGLPKGVVPAALAETILLSLEGKISNYSFGEIKFSDQTIYLFSEFLH